MFEMIKIYITAILSLFILLPFGLILFLPFLIHRYIVFVLAKIFKPELIQMLSSHDSIFITSKNPNDLFWSNILVRFKIDGEYNHIQFLKGISENLINNTSSNGVADGGEDDNKKLNCIKLRQYWIQWLGFGFWKWENNFSIENHITVYNGPILKNEEHLFEYEQIIHSQSFSFNRSPWNMIIFQNKYLQYRKNEEKEGDKPWFLILFKIHHTLGDGYSLFNALMNLADNPVPLYKPSSISTALALNGRINKIQFISKILTLPWKVALDFSKDVRQKNLYTSDLDMTTNAQKNADKRERHIIKSKLMSNLLVKNIAKKFNISFSAVVYGAFTGGIRNYMIQQGMKIPSKIICMTPFPSLHHFQAGLSNIIVLVNMELPIGEEDIEKRLQIIENSFTYLFKSGSSTMPLLVNYFFKIIGCLPYGIRMSLPDFGSVPLFFTTFPGPNKPITIQGQLVTEANYSMYGGTQSFGISLLTYNGTFTFITSFDKYMFPQKEMAQELNIAIENEFILLHNSK